MKDTKQKLKDKKLMLVKILKSGMNKNEFENKLKEVKGGRWHKVIYLAENRTETIWVEEGQAAPIFGNLDLNVIDEKES